MVMLVRSDSSAVDKTWLDWHSSTTARCTCIPYNTLGLTSDFADILQSVVSYVDTIISRLL